MIGLFKSAPDFRALSSTFSQNKRSFCHIDVLLVFVIPLFSLHPKIPAQVPAPNISFQPLSPSQLLMLRGFFFSTAISLWICVFCSLQSKNPFWWYWKSLWLWSTFYIKYTKIVGNIGAAAIKHRNISAFLGNHPLQFLPKDYLEAAGML